MKKRDIKPFGLRLQDEVKEKLRTEASACRRSMNTEAEMLILDGFKWREQQGRQAVA